MDIQTIKLRAQGQKIYNDMIRALELTEGSEADWRGMFGSMELMINAQERRKQRMMQKGNSLSVYTLQRLWALQYAKKLLKEQYNNIFSQQ